MIDMPELCAQVRAGDRAAADELVRRIQMGLRPKLLRELEPEDVDDVLQETCLAVVMGVQSDDIEHPVNPFSYAHRIARNKRLNVIRAIKPRAALEPLRVPATQEEHVIKADRLLTLMELMSGLDPVDQKIIKLTCFEDHSRHEAAEKLQMTPLQVSVRKTRAIATMRKAYRRMNRLKGIRSIAA